MPRKEYNTLTLRRETHERIVEAIRKAKKKNQRMYTSEFVEMLFDLYEGKRS